MSARWRVWVFDDVGSLSTADHRLVFTGRSGRIEFDAPRACREARPSLAWKTWGLAILMTVATLGPLFWWLGMLRLFVAGYFGWLVVLYAAATRRMWVEVQALDRNVTTRVYFADASYRGWRALLCGAGEFLAELQGVLERLR